MIVSRAVFDIAVEAVWSEIEYQNNLPRRTEESEAKGPEGFATLGRVYLRRLEDAWSDNKGNEAALPFVRKLAAIFIRGMIYSGIRDRK